jgi:hypothetical protein
MKPLFDRQWNPAWLFMHQVEAPEPGRSDRTLYAEPDFESQEELVKGMRDTLRHVKSLYHEPHHPVVFANPLHDPTRDAFYSNGLPMLLQEPRALIVGANYSVTGVQTARHALQAWTQTFTVLAYVLPEEYDPKRKNKLARKNRDGVRASQNATGRKWWEHR